jgi:DNA-binding LacI/PurR family transcriptional regulator
MGRQAMNALLERIRDPQRPVHTVVMPCRMTLKGAEICRRREHDL